MRATFAGELISGTKITAVGRAGEVAVPPGGALLEKLGALAPGATDVLVRGAMNLARRSTRKRTN